MSAKTNDSLRPDDRAEVPMNVDETVDEVTPPLSGGNLEVSGEPADGVVHPV